MKLDGITFDMLVNDFLNKTLEDQLKCDSLIKSLFLSLNKFDKRRLRLLDLILYKRDSVKDIIAGPPMIAKQGCHLSNDELVKIVDYIYNNSDYKLAGYLNYYIYINLPNELKEKIIHLIIMDELQK